MMLEHVLDICREVQTRPGYKIETYAITNGQSNIVFHLPILIDADTGTHTPENSTLQLSKNLSREFVENWRLEDVLCWIYGRFIELESHEQKEFLKYKGKRFFNPHPELPKNKEVWL